MKRCEVNDEHFYDGDMFPKCPYCLHHTYNDNRKSNNDNGKYSLKRCEAGEHFYDSDMYTECPYCDDFKKEFPWD